DSSRAATATLAPASASPTASASPMPRLAPVTSALRPLSEKDGLGMRRLRLLGFRRAVRPCIEAAVLRSGATMTDHDPTCDAADTLTAGAGRLTGAGRWRGAERVIGRLIAGTFGLAVAAVEINRDRYSLNSLNGFTTTADGRAFFFKFHQEEGEADTVGE